jgi:hypothetical protein
LHGRPVLAPGIQTPVDGDRRIVMQGTTPAQDQLVLRAAYCVGGVARWASRCLSPVR